MSQSSFYKRVRGADKYRYMPDGLGSTRQLTSEAQAVTDSYTFDAWGGSVASSGTTINPFRYVGRENYYTDTQSSLLLLGVRYYNPSIGRFITMDPIGLRGGDLNLYRYVKDMPVNLADSAGKRPPSDYTQVYPGYGYREWQPGDPANIGVDYNWKPAERWKSEKPTDDDRRLEKIWWVRAYAGGIFAQDAGEHLRHFLRGTGKRLDKDFLDLYFAVATGAMDVVSDEYDSFIKKAQSLRARKRKYHLISNKLREVSMGKYSNPVWHYALGTYSVWGDGEISITCEHGEKKIRGEVSFKLYDPYDWHPEYGGFDPELHRLHVVGLAQEYLITGHITTMPVRLPAWPPW